MERKKLAFLIGAIFLSLSILTSMAAGSEPMKPDGPQTIENPPTHIPIAPQENYHDGGVDSTLMGISMLYAIASGIFLGYALYF